MASKKWKYTWKIADVLKSYFWTVLQSKTNFLGHMPI